MPAPSSSATSKEHDGLLLLSRLEEALTDSIEDVNANEVQQQQQQQQHRRYQSVDAASNESGRGGARHGRPPLRRHRQHRSSIRELVIDTLEPIGEEFQHTGRLLSSSLLQRLDSIDHGKTGFFDMSMTRNLSVLPDDLGDLMEDVTGIESTREDEVHPLLADTTGSSATDALVEGSTATTGPPPITQYLALLGAVTAVSSNSTALHMLHGVSAPLKLYWRMTASYCALVPLVAHSLYHHNHNRNNQKSGNDETSSVVVFMSALNLSEWLTFGAAVVAYTTHNLLFYKALDYTTIGNAVFYANSQALLLIIAKACMGHGIHPLEAVGVVVAFTGAIFCSKDSESAEEEEESSSSSDEQRDGNDEDLPAIVGDLMALGAAVAGVAYLTFAKAVRPHMSVTLFMFSVLFSGSFLVLAYIALTEPHGDLKFNMDPYVGVFGWLDMTEKRLPVILHLAVVVNMIGTMGFVRAMQYFENVVISVATLMEPLMASLIAYAFQIGLLPGPLGWIGNILVIVGTLGVVYPSMGKKGGGGGGGGDDMH